MSEMNTLSHIEKLIKAESNRCKKHFQKAELLFVIIYFDKQFSNMRRAPTLVVII